jgi:hypothetical protein
MGLFRKAVSKAMSSLIAPIAAILINLATQIVLYRTRRGREYFRSIIEGFFAGAIALAGSEAFFILSEHALTDRLILALAVNGPIYFCLSYCYYSFVQLGQTSIRIRMYTEIALRPSGVMISEIEREYDEKGLTEVRLQRLLESGDVIERDGNYFIGRTRLLHIAHVIFAAKHFLLRKKSEFD